MRKAGFIKLAITTILILQLAHTLLIAAADIIFSVERRRFLMSESKYTFWTASWILALAAVIFLLWSFLKHKPWVWPWILILIVNVSLFLLLDLLPLHRSLPVLLDGVLLAATICGFAALWLSRNAYSTTRNDIYKVLFAILLWACTAPIFNKRYWDSVGIFIIPGHALELWPQESQLLLCWGYFALVASLLEGFCRTRLTKRVRP